MIGDIKMNIGLKTGVVKLLPHQTEWETILFSC